MINSVDTGKAFENNLTPSKITILSKLGVEENFFNLRNDVQNRMVVLKIDM